MLEALEQKNSTYFLLEKRFLAIQLLDCGHSDAVLGLTPVQESREYVTAAMVSCATPRTHEPTSLLSDGELNHASMLLPECKSRCLFVFLVAFD